MFALFVASTLARPCASVVPPARSSVAEPPFLPVVTPKVSGTLGSAVPLGERSCIMIHVPSFTKPLVAPGAVAMVAEATSNTSTGTVSDAPPSGHWTLSEQPSAAGPALKPE